MVWRLWAGYFLGAGLMPAKYTYCPFGHPRPLYMEKCPVCIDAPKKAPRPEGRYGSRTDENVTVTKSSHGGARTDSGRKRQHQTNAERQAAYRERRG